MDTFDIPASFEIENEQSGMRITITQWSLIMFRDLFIVLPMREPSIFGGIAVLLLRPVIGDWIYVRN